MSSGLPLEDSKWRVDHPTQDGADSESQRIGMKSAQPRGARMRGHLWHESPVNRYLLCAVLAKQTRRLGRVIPEMRVTQLIGVALRSCCEHEIAIQMGDNTPDVICEEAGRMFTLLKHSDLSLAPAAEFPGESQAGNGGSVVKQQAGEEDKPDKDQPDPSPSSADAHVPVGNRVRSADSGCHLPSLPRKSSMSNAHGTDRMRQVQLLALAENLYTLAKRHHENGKHVVAHALYGRALEVAAGLDGPELKESGSALRTKIKNDRQAVFEMLRLGDSGLRCVPLEKAQKPGQ